MISIKIEIEIEQDNEFEIDHDDSRRLTQELADRCHIECNARFMPGKDSETLCPRHTVEIPHCPTRRRWKCVGFASYAKPDCKRKDFILKMMQSALTFEEAKMEIEGKYCPDCRQGKNENRDQSGQCWDRHV